MPRKPTIFHHFFLDCMEDCYKAMLSCGEGYASRSLVLSRPGDVVQLPEFLRDEWDWAREHYRSVGLEVADEIVWDTQVDVLRDFDRASWDWSVFFWGQEIDGIAPDPRRQEIIAELNDKNRFFAFAREHGAAVPRTLAVPAGEMTVAIGEEFGFPCLLKPAWSAQGMGMQLCDSADELGAYLKSGACRGDLQVQEFLPDHTVFQNVMYECADGGASRQMVTDQILNGFTHGGNASPVEPVAPWEVTDGLAGAAAASGMVGQLGFDVAIIPGGDGAFSYQLVDCNPRFNGASYPIGVAQRLGLDIWRIRSYPIPQAPVENLGLEKLAYDPRRKAGVVVVNWAASEENKLGILCTAPDWEQLREVEKELEIICAAGGA